MRSKFPAILIFLVTACCDIAAQNLVPNPGFEKYKKIPASFCHNTSEFNSFIYNWTLPNIATSDYFHAKSRTNASTMKNNFVGNQPPQEGFAYAGFFLYEPAAPEYREYLEVRLLKPLIAGQKYAVSYYVSLAEASEFGIDHFGVLFTKKMVRQKNSQFIKGGASAETSDSVFFDDKNKWMLVRIIYTARGGEQYMTIGNFRDSESMHFKKVVVDKKKYYKENGAYYYVDNVCVSAIDKDGKDACPCETKPAIIDTAVVIADTPAVITPPVLQKEPQVFTSVYFDTDKAILKPQSYGSLDSLAEFLLKNPDISIEISGHTDNDGEEAHNLELSQRRAKAVADYFISKGISAGRISYYGYGSSRPIADNSTAAGKAKNRRVEYRLSRN
jgi:OmpA-OmpF porin, OOP family